MLMLNALAGFGARRRGGLDAVIMALFASGEQGAWYDPSDLSTMFQDSAGTIPVTADGQPVGKILDKSGRGNHATQATAASRPLYKTDGTYHWLQFDGVDDSLSTASFAWGTDKSTAVVGIKNNNTSTGICFSFGSNPIVDIGSFGSYTRISADGDYSIAAKGTTQSYWKTAPASIPRTNVASFIYDLGQVDDADSLKMRLNGSSETLSFVGGGDMGGGNFATHSLYVGTRGDGSMKLLGNIYSLIVRGALSTADEITATETWVNGKTGAY